MKVENAVKVEPVGEFELKGDQAAPGGVQCARSDSMTVRRMFRPRDTKV